MASSHEWVHAFTSGPEHITLPLSTCRRASALSRLFVEEMARLTVPWARCCVRAPCQTCRAARSSWYVETLWIWTLALRSEGRSLRGAARRVTSVTATGRRQSVIDEGIDVRSRVMALHGEWADRRRQAPRTLMPRASSPVRCFGSSSTRSEASRGCRRARKRARVSQPYLEWSQSDMTGSICHGQSWSVFGRLYLGVIGR